METSLSTALMSSKNSPSNNVFAVLNRENRELQEKLIEIVDKYYNSPALEFYDLMEELKKETAKKIFQEMEKE